MITKKIQKNKGPVQLHFGKNGAGFVILFAVTLSAILLAIALGVSNIALREVRFSTDARSTNDAFFAADTGAECALFIAKSTENFTKSGTVECLGKSFSVQASLPQNFIIPYLGSANESCADVTVTQDTNEISITSKGYNIGDSNCTSSNKDRIEREIKIDYLN